MFDEEHVRAFEHMLEQSQGDDTLEIEIRLGRLLPPREAVGYHPGGSSIRPFEADVGEHALHIIRRCLKSNPDWAQVDTNEFVDSFFPDSVRTSTYQDGTVLTVQKERVQTYDIPMPNHPFDVRISISREVFVNPPMWPSHGYRTKSRESFRYKDRFLYEVTEVRDHQNRHTFEFELELFRPQRFLAERGCRYVAESALCKVRDVLGFFDVPSNSVRGPNETTR